MFFAVPPDPVVIFDETGKHRASVIGPYLVGDKIHLVCDAFGGKLILKNKYISAKKLRLLLLWVWDYIDVSKGVIKKLDPFAVSDALKNCKTVLLMLPAS